MANFCKKCGSPLDQNTGLCPKCNQTNHHEIVNSSASKNTLKKKNNAIIKFFIMILALFMIGSIAFCALVYFDIIKNDTINNYFVSLGFKDEDDKPYERNNSGNKDESTNESETETTTEEVTYDTMSFDAEEYFDENAEIINKIDAKTSKDVISEADAYKEFVDRGFNKYPITTEYSMDGTYSETKEIDQNSTDKHPMYGTYYLDEDDNLWSVSLINGNFFATPLTYNLENVEQQVILSETDTLMSYDGDSNTFFETIPNESVYQIMIVDKIDSKALNNDLLEEY